MIIGHEIVHGIDYIINALIKKTASFMLSLKLFYCMGIERILKHTSFRAVFKNILPVPFSQRQIFLFVERMSHNFPLRDGEHRRIDK